MNSRYRPHDYATAKDMQDRVEYTISQDRGTGSSGQAEADYSILIKKDIDLAALIQEPRYPTVTEADIWAARATYSAGETPGPEGDERDENDQSEEYVSEEDVDEKDAAQGAPSSLPRKPKRTQQLEEDVGEPHFADDAKLASGPPLKRFKARQDTPSPHFFASMDANSSIRASKGVNKQQGKEPGKQILRSAADEPVQDIKQPALDNEYHILHRVVCSSTHEQCNRRIYLDKPRRVKRGRSHHLRGEHLILDLNDFLQDRPSIIFIVYRDYFCEQGTRYSTPSYSANHTTTKFFREMFSILSYELQNILQRNSKFAPNVEAYKFTEYESHKYYSSPALSTSPSEYSHRFLYHHRDVLDAEAAAARGASPIKVLVSYLESSSNDMYRRCDELFARGVVTPDTLPWLFRPNDVLVSANGPLRTAYVLRQFPTEGSHLDLMCWNWAYDGHRLHRKDTSLTVKTPTCDEARIDQLTVYPLSYAAKETAQEILANGVKFWVLRNPTSVSYEGPDYQGEGIYVGEMASLYSIYIADRCFNLPSQTTRGSWWTTRPTKSSMARRTHLEPQARPDQCLTSGPKHSRDKTNCRINSWFFSLAVSTAFISKRRNGVGCFTFPRLLVVYMCETDSLILISSTSPSRRNPAYKLEQGCL